MGRKFLHWSGLIIGFGFASLAFGQGAETEKTKTDTNREVVRTYARVYEEMGQYTNADNLLWDYLTRENGDGGLWVLLGQIQSKEKKFSQACYAFQKASSVSKGVRERVYADYRLAGCLNQGGRTQESKKLLEKIISDASEFSNSPERTLAMVKSGVLPSGAEFPEFELLTKGRFRLSAIVGSGFDTNVLLVEEDVASGVAVSDRGSFFVSPGVQVGYSGKVFGREFESRYMVSFTDYLNSVAKSYNGLYQRADFLMGTGAIHYGLYVDTYFLNKTTFSIYDWEAGLNFSQLLDVTAKHVYMVEVPVQYQKYVNDSTVTAINDRTGADLKIRGTSRFILSEGEMLSVQLGLDTQFTKGQNYKQIGVDLPIQWVKPLPYLRNYGITNTFSLAGTAADYYKSETGRRDVLLKVGAGMSKTFFQEWNVGLDYSLQKNVSNLASARYLKGIISLQLSHEFI